MRFAFVWFVQGIWVLVVSLPTLLTNLSKRTVPMGPAGYAAAGLFLLGLVFEAGADLQKMAFKANPENEGKFIQSGFWGLSRHPNCKLLPLTHTPARTLSRLFHSLSGRPEFHLCLLAMPG